MKTILLTSALTLGAMTTVALAESVIPTGGQAGPVLLTSTQMDKVTAGALQTIDLGYTNPSGHLKATPCGSCTPVTETVSPGQAKKLGL